MLVKFYDKIDDDLLKFAVIISKSNSKWVFCKHRDRDTYEVPGGHREAGEFEEELHSEMEKGGLAGWITRWMDLSVDSAVTDCGVWEKKVNSNLFGFAG